MASAVIERSFPMSWRISQNTQTHRLTPVAQQENRSIWSSSKSDRLQIRICWRLLLKPKPIPAPSDSMFTPSPQFTFRFTPWDLSRRSCIRGLLDGEMLWVLFRGSQRFSLLQNWIIVLLDRYMYICIYIYRVRDTTKNHVYISRQIG